MKNVLHMFLKIMVICNIICWTFINEAMDPPRSRSGSPAERQFPGAKFQKKLKLWNNNQLVLSGVQQSAVASASLLITPKEDGILFTQPGKVLYLHRAVLSDQPPYEICGYNHLKFSPLIAVASEKESSSGKEILIVVSALNNRSRKSETPKIAVRLNRLVVSHPPYMSHSIFSNNTLEVIDINYSQERPSNTLEFSHSNIQAMKLHEDGKLLVVAFRDHIRMIDLRTKEVNKSYFMPRIMPGSHVVDVSMPIDVSRNSSEQYVAAVSNSGIVEVKKYSQEYERPIFSNLKHVKTGDAIEKIVMPSAGDLLYVVSGGKLKQIPIHDWLEHSDDLIKSNILMDDKGNMASIDEDSVYSSIHWNDNHGLPDAHYADMTVYRQNGTVKNEINITIPDLPEKYPFINEKGQEMFETSRILLAALRGNCVAAITTEGYVYFWQLPEKQQVPTEESVRDNSKPPYSRMRSLSSPVEEHIIKNHRQTSSTAIVKANDEKRKSAKRGENVPKLNIFKSSKESLLKDTNRETKESASPSGSPRKTNPKDKTPRMRKSVPPKYETKTDVQVLTSLDELKKLNLEQQDMINDINRG